MSDPDNETVLRPNGTRDFLPAATLETLRWRARLLAATRSFFDARAYWEVETPLLSRDVVVDANLEPFTTRWIADGATNHDASETSFGDELFLQTSPEFGMKRLLSAGATAIYQITRAMRNGECGRFHNPEFTMIEWYRVGETHHDQMRLVEDLVVELMQLSAEFRGTNRAATARAFAGALDHPFERITYDAAFERYAGTKVIGLSTKELPLLARRRGVSSPPGLHAEDRDGWLNLLLAELVQPHLGRERCTFLYDYPASQAALARIRRDDPPVAERFELYVDGIEICNGYHELTDPDELRERMRSQAAVRAAHGRRGLPEQNRLLDAMESGLPACAGVAAGFDRLVMLAVGAESIAEVIAFPFDRA